MVEAPQFNSTEVTVAEARHKPAGNYPEHARVHHIDLEAASARLLDGLTNRRKAETLVREAGVSVVLMAMPAGDALREHDADGVVSVQVLEGRASLTAEGQAITLKPRELVLFQPGVRHDLQAEAQALVLLTITGGATDG